MEGTSKRTRNESPMPFFHSDMRTTRSSHRENSPLLPDTLPFSSSGSSTRLLRLVGQSNCLSTESYALLLLSLSAFLYSVMGTFVKLAVTEGGLPSTEMVLLRAIVQGVVVVTAMMFWREHDHSNSRLIWVPLGRTPIRNVVVARGMVGGLGFLFYYYTMSVLPLGDATTLLSLNPVLTVIAGAVVLKESLHISHVVAALGSVVGCVFMARPSFLFDQHGAAVHSSSTPSLGYLTAALGACCGATVYILIRRAGKGGVHTLQLLFSWVLFGIVFSLLVGVALPWINGKGSTFVWPADSQTWRYVLGTCVFGSSGHFLLNYAARHAPAGLSSIIRTSGIVWSYMLELLVFHQGPVPLVTAGVLLIVASLATIALEKQCCGSGSR